MPSMDTLTHIVYCLCNNLEYSTPNLTEPEQYEAQLEDLLIEEYIIKEVVFKTAVAYVNQKEYNDYLGYILRVLSTFSNMLEHTLADEKADKNSPVVLLQQDALSVIKRLTTFLLARFPHAKAWDADNSADAEMFKLPISVGRMATLTKGVIKATGVPDGKVAVVIRFIIRHFSSMNTEKIAYDSFRKHYDNPEAGAIREIIKILEKIIAYLKEL